MTESLTVLGILVDHRDRKAPQIQEIITRYGEQILCRMGIPSPSKENGLIILVLEGDSSDIRRFSEELRDIDGVQVQTMSFTT